MKTGDGEILAGSPILGGHDLPKDLWMKSDPFGGEVAWSDVFQNDQPVEMDLGAGDGGFIMEWAARHPEKNFVAVERLLGRARKIAKKSKARGLSNLRTLRLESGYVVRYLCPRESLDRIHIMFPDPWEKRKQRKFRLIQPWFLAACWRVVKPGGTIRFTTDHEEYFNFACEVWAGAPGWRRLGPWDASGEPQSDFQRHFAVEGRKENRCAWERVPVEGVDMDELSALPFPWNGERDELEEGFADIIQEKGED
jgi:tRNA (guanine-N7-)-methyltransferase